MRSIRLACARRRSPGLPTVLIAIVRDRRAALEHQRQLVGEGDRLGAASSSCQPAMKPDRNCARPFDILTKLDGILRFEVAAGDIVGPGEWDECHLPFRTERTRCCPAMPDADPNRRRAAGRRWPYGRIRPGDRERRSRRVVEIAGHRDDDVGRVIGAAQEHHEQAGVRSARRRPADGPPRHRRECRDASGSSRRVRRICVSSCLRSPHEFGEDRKSVFQSCGEVAWSSAAARLLRRKFRLQAIEIEAVLQQSETPAVSARRSVGLEQPARNSEPI